VSVQGRVEVRRTGQTKWQRVLLNDICSSGDMIRVQPNSRAVVVLSNNAVLRLDAKTTLLFPETKQAPSSLLALFNRNKAVLQADGLVGDEGTWGAEGVVSAIYNRLSLSAGYTHFQTDGFRTNNDQDDDIANAFAQYELTYQTSIQAEYRYRNIRRGETQPRFFADDIDHTNLYLYSYLKPHKKITLTLGACGEFFNSSGLDTRDTNQLNH
jgi:hypothetical protein